MVVLCQLSSTLTVPIWTLKSCCGSRPEHVLRSPLPSPLPRQMQKSTATQYTSSTFPLGNHYNQREVALQQVLTFLLLTHWSVTVHNISELALLVQSSSPKKNLPPLKTEIEATAIGDTMLEYSKSIFMKMICRQYNDVKLQGKVTFLYPISFHYYLMVRFSTAKYAGLSKTPV